MPTNRLYNSISRHTVAVISAFVVIFVAALYLSVASTRLTNSNFGSDGGDFLAAILTQGIPHPSGYPTYTLVGILFQYISIGTPVFRGVLASAIPAALGAGLLTGWVGFVAGGKSTPNLIAAFVAGSAWGVAPLFFSQAVIVEVHGLQSLIVVLVLWWITLNLQVNSGPYSKWILGLSFIVGLGCGNHLTILLLAPAALIALIYSTRHSGSWKLILAQIGLVMAGLLVYAYLPVRAITYPPINWGNPQTWPGFLWEVTASPYRSLLFGVQNPDLGERIRSIASLLLDQFGAFGLAAGVIGAIQFSHPIKWMRWILVWIFAAYFVFAIGYRAEDSVGYLLPAIMVFAIWSGLAIPALWQIKWRRVPVGILLISILIISVYWRVPETRIRLDTRTQDQPARYAEQLLQEAPQNAIVYTTTDQDTFPLWYYHFGLGERPDLRIIVIPLTQFAWYQQTLLQTYPDLVFPNLSPKDLPSADWGKQIRELNPGRAVCNTKVTSETEIGVAYECASP